MTLLDLSFDPPAAVVAAALVIAALATWRWPLVGMTVAILSLGIDLTQFSIHGGTPLAFGPRQTLVALALIVCALKFGVRREINWPLLAFGAIFVINLVISDLHPHLNFGLMAACLAVVVLPWCTTQVILPAGTRRHFGLMVALAAPFSVLASGAFDLLGADGAYRLPRFILGWLGPLIGDAGLGKTYLRLQGASGNPAELAMLAFAGLAASLNEWTRIRARHFAALAALNIGIVLLSGTRGALVAALVLILLVICLSPATRALLRAHRREVFAGLLLLVLLVILYLPNLERRLLDPSGAVALSDRNYVWAFYWQEFLMAPWFGRGIGAGFVSLGDYIQRRHDTPHNDLLHLLVSGGIVGLLIAAPALILWFRNLFRAASADDRRFLVALMPATLAFSLTWDLLIFPHTLALFVYLSALLIKPVVIRKQAARTTRPARTRVRGAADLVPETGGATSREPASQEVRRSVRRTRLFGPEQPS